jgi:Tfp pilus assembly protein PilO
MAERATSIESTARVPALFVAALSLLIVTAVSGLSYVLWIRPLYQQYIRKDNALNNQAQILSLLQMSKSDPSAYDQQIAVYKSQIDSVTNQFPTLDSATELMNQAITEASRHGLHFQSIEQAPAKVRADYSILPTHVVMMGSYLDLLNWLYWVSDTHSAIQVENVTLSVFSQDDEKTVLTAEFDFRVYARVLPIYGVSK